MMWARVQVVHRTSCYRPTMEGRTLLVKLLCIFCLGTTASCLALKLTEGIECSTEYQNLCAVANKTTNQEDSEQRGDCRVIINVCPSADNNIVFAYLPPPKYAKYGIAEGHVYLNMYQGAESDDFDRFRINLSPKKSCRFTDVLPGEYDIWIYPIDPNSDDYDYQSDECGSQYYSSSTKFVVDSNSTDVYTATQNNTISVTTSSTSSDVVTKSTDALWNNNDTPTSVKVPTSGDITPYHDNTNTVTTPCVTISDSSVERTISQKQTSAGNKGLTKTQLFIMIIVVSACLLVISIIIMVIVRNRYHRCRTSYAISGIKHDVDVVTRREKHEKGRENNTPTKTDSGIHDLDTEEGFLQSDVATLKERYGPIYSDKGQYSALSFDIYEYMQSNKHHRDPSIYSAVTILDGTFEMAKYVHPLFDDRACDNSGHYGNSWVPSTDSHVDPSSIQTLRINQTEKQTDHASDTHPSAQNRTIYGSVSNRNEDLSQRDCQCVRQTFPQNQDSLRKGCDNMFQNVDDNTCDFIPPDSTLSECNDVTSRTLAQGMSEINRNYFRNVSFIDEHNTRTCCIVKGKTEMNRNNSVVCDSVPESCYNTYMEVDLTDDSSDISIGGISV